MNKAVENFSKWIRIERQKLQENVDYWASQSGSEGNLMVAESELAECDKIIETFTRCMRDVTYEPAKGDTDE